LSHDESQKNAWSPKAALIWNVSPALTLRGVFSRALGGVSYDESVRLEPTQLAGFDQAFRSIISESIVGSVEAPEYQIGGGALDWRLGPKTWLTVQGQALREQVDNPFGFFAFNFGAFPATGSPAETYKDLLYHETSAIATVNDIIARDWFLQAQYEFSYSDLKMTLPDIPATPSFDRTTDLWGGLHQVHLAATWQAPAGWFARGEVAWFGQNLGGSSAQPPGGHFAQVNLYGGYRFRHRRAELTVGVLNLTGGGYNLSPIDYYLDLPYQRLFYTRFKFNF
jgi:outer membrane receptor protein involved in Fe transport